MIQISGGQEAENAGVKKSGHNIPVAPEIRVCHAILFCVAHFPHGGLSAYIWRNKVPGSISPCFAGVVKQVVLLLPQK